LEGALPEKKVRVQLPGQSGTVEAVEVPVAESTERWSDVTLGDGATLRIKPVVLSAVRVDGQYDQDGNPVYQVKVNQIVTISAPDHLRKGAGDPSKPH
jgi:hypothetical protein